MDASLALASDDDLVAILVTARAESISHERCGDRCPYRVAAIRDQDAALTEMWWRQTRAQRAAS